MLQSPLQHCERTDAVVQAEVAECRQREQEWQQVEIVCELERRTVDSKSNDSSAETLRDRILEATTAAAHALLAVEDFDQAVNTALQIIGECLDADRVNIIEIFEHPSGAPFPTWRILYEWDAAGTLSQISHPDYAQGNYEGIEAWYSLLQQGQSISCLLEDMPEPFRSVMAAVEVKALHAVPIFVEGKFWGNVGFDDCRTAKQRTSAELTLLKIAADCIGSAIQRERIQQALLQAEQKRAAELAAANRALQKGVERLVASGTIDAVLDSFLLETVAVTGAAAGAVMQRGVGHEFIMQSLVENGRAIYPFDPHTSEEVYRQRTAADTSGIMRRTAEGEVLVFPVEGVEEWFPEAAAYHRARGHRTIWHFPFQVGGQVAGYLGLAFCDERSPSDTVRETVQTLAHQVSLALEIQQLAEAAKQAAVAKLNEVIAREQEKAAQQQAAELSRANTLLRNSLSRLSTSPNLQDVLGHLLVELVRYAGASVGHIFIHDPTQKTLTLSVRCQDGQAFWTPAEDEPVLFKSPIPIEQTPIFTHLCAQPRLAILNEDKFEGRLWQGIPEWFRVKGYRSTCSCVLMAGDRPFGMLAMAFSQPIAFRSVEEELILALTQQIALVIQLTTLGEADKQAAVAKLNEVIAREQERAAQERATELAKANDALKHSLDRLAQESDLDSFLGHVLNEIANQVQAAAGHIFLLDVETNTLELCLEIQNGKLYHQARPNEPKLFQSAVPADITPIFQYLCEKRTLSSVSAGEFDGMAWAGTSEWFEREGFTEAVCLALIVGEQPVGMLGLAFRDKSTLQPEEAELIHALAHQATLAIQLTRLAEEAKRVAIFEERNRMASEIHDTLAQVFTGISLQLEVAKPLVHREPETVEQILEHISQLAKTGLTEARRSVWALYPPAAEYADLAQMLYESVEYMTRNTSIAVEVNVQGNPCPLSPFVGMNLLRIGQEALTNAIKHAQAQTVSIELTYEADRIWLTICDDGRGFIPPTNISSLNGGFGLVGMYERCDRIGAQLSLSSQLGQGTQILVEAPLN